MPAAVFVDRDGVLNQLVYNPATAEYESPHRVEDFALLPGVLEPLIKLQQAGYLLFLVSNQPSYAKGKTSLENIQAIHGRLHQALTSQGVNFTEYFYCYHHPEGTVPGFGGLCPCRKPSPYFLFQARDRFGVDLSQSWMVGDEERDMLCGKAAGVRTIQVHNPYSIKKRGKANPEFSVSELGEAADIILK